MPSAEDAATLSANFQVIISCILTQHILGVEDTPVVLHDHNILHAYSKEMGKKSEVVSFLHLFVQVHALQVPLGVFLKDENKLDEMVDILDDLHKNVPTVRTTQDVKVTSTGETTQTKTIHTDHFNHILLGGDQLTVARIRGCHRMHTNTHNGRDGCEGLLPVVEDWHTKMCFMKVLITCIRRRLV